MPQKLDVHGLFIDPETITDLYLQKRIAVSYPVFYEDAPSKSIFGRAFSLQQHVLRFDHHEPYGIILSDAERPDPASYAVSYREALTDRLLRDLKRTCDSITGHIAEMLRIDTSGDRQYRILQAGRNVKQISIREIPAKVRLQSGQWVDVFKNSPGYDFQGGTPYAVTDVEAWTLMIAVKDKRYVLFGGGVDVSDAEVLSTYRALTEVYNEIQAARDAATAARAKKPLFQMPQINIQLPKVELPKIEMPTIRFQPPVLFGKKEEKQHAEALPESDEKEHG